MENTIEVLRKIDNLWEIVKIIPSDKLTNDILLDENFEEMFADIKWTEDQKVKRFLVIFTSVSFILWLLGIVFLPTGDRILSVPMYASVAIDVLWLIDKYLLRNVDLIHEFKNKNYNVGLWLIALCVLIGYIISVVS
jgi:hypothetical protein